MNLTDYYKKYWQYSKTNVSDPKVDNYSKVLIVLGLVLFSLLMTFLWILYFLSEFSEESIKGEKEINKIRSQPIKW